MEPTTTLATVTYKKVRNLGNYESEALEISLQQSEGEAINDTIIRVKALVATGLYGEQPKAKEVPVAKQPVQSTAPKAEPVEVKAKDVEPVAEVAEVVVAVEQQPVEEEVKKQPAKKQPAKKRPSTAPTVYDRENDAHRKMLGKLIVEVTNNANWVKDESLKAIGVALSHSLVGKDFVEANGELCESLVASVRTAFNK